MDTGYRWALLGLGAMTATLVARQIDLGRGVANDADVRVRAAKHEQQGQGQRYRGLMLDRKLDVRTGGVLSVEVEDGDVEVRSGADGSASVQVWAQARDMDWAREVFERMQLEVGEESSGVFVRARDPRIRGNEWSDDRGVGFKIEITIPERFDVDIRTSDGDITVYASPSLQADLELQGSDVQVDLEMRVVGRIGQSGARGQLNGGGPLLIARTGDGTIMIREPRR